MNQYVEFLRQRHCLTTCTTTCVNDNMKLLFRKKAQHMQGMSIAPWAELFHTSEEKVNWIVSVHISKHETQAELQTPARIGAGDHTKARAAERAAWQIEVRMIESTEHLQAELHLIDTHDRARQLAREITQVSGLDQQTARQLVLDAKVELL